MAQGRFDSPIIASLTGIKDIFRKQPLNHRLKDQNRSDNKTCLITGANSGLGFALAVEMAHRGANVIMACRRDIPDAGNRVRQLSGSDLIEMVHLDLSKLDSIHSFCDHLRNMKIRPDITILNAGVATPQARKTESGLDEIFLVNYLANFILLNRMLMDGTIPNKTCAGNNYSPGKIPRVIFISSDSHRGSSYIDYDEFGKFFNYGLKKGMNNYSYYKLVLNTLAIEFSRRLNKNGLEVSLNSICPGPVNTNIIRSAPWLVRIILRVIFSIIFQAPEKAAKAVVYLAISEDYKNRTGAYLHMFIEKPMDEKVYIPEEGKKLWEHSAEVWKSVDMKAKICPI
ncbi:MAG: SDR family NAD(P)-dependent oxidoreductase [Bacteroidales bacterium]|nr:SDR family NAD(P)-dependent oxidoreductase [Bacteroidales bacterium]